MSFLGWAAGAIVVSKIIKKEKQRQRAAKEGARSFLWSLENNSESYDEDDDEDDYEYERGQQEPRIPCRFVDGFSEEEFEDEIIRLKAVDTRLLLNSFHKGSADNVYEINEGDLSLEIGTNVQYAKWVNDGHKQKPGRFIPGEWNGDGKFRYIPGAKTGMVLKANYVEGKHYMENSVKIMQKMFPKLVEAKLAQWMDSYFS